MKVGDIVWIRSDNNRVYDENRKMIYERTFAPAEVTGETKRSWIIDNKYTTPKLYLVPCEISHNGYHIGTLHTSETKEEDIWLKKNKQKLINFLNSQESSKLLRIVEQELIKHSTEYQKEIN